LTAIRLKLLGGAWVEANETPVSGRAVQRRRLALLAILAVARGAPVSRDRILGLLWADSGMQQARHLLSVALHEMRRLLGENVIMATNDGVTLSRASVWCDVMEFEQALAAGADADAIAAYGGRFLDGFHLSDAPEFEQWVDGERERLARLYHAALERRANALQADGDTNGAVEVWRKLAADDPYNSRIALALMNALDAAGDRAGAIRHARVHESLLRAELDAEAPPELLELAEKLRTAPPRDVAAQPVGAVTGPAQPPAAAPVTVTHAATPPVAPAKRVSPHRVQRRRRVLAGAIALTGALGIIVLFVRQYDAQRIDLPDNTLAVRRLIDLDAGTDRVFADGLTSELTNRLRDIDSLNVIPASSSLSLRDDSLATRDVAQRLISRYILEGSVRRGNSGRLRIILELVDAESNRTIWDGDYDRTADDVLTVQKEVAADVAQELALEFRSTPAERDARNADAYQLYVSGIGQFMQRTPQSLLAAVESFESAVKLEPTYAPAHAMLAHSYNLLGAYDYGLMRPRDAYALAERESNVALGLDRNLPEAHAAFAAVLMNHKRDYAGAERSFHDALRLNPAYGQARFWYGLLLTARGRPDRGLEETQLAHEAEPLSPVISAGLARQYYFRRDYRTAIQRYREVLDTEPEFAPAHTGLALALDVSGDAAEAAREYARLMSDSTRIHPLWLSLQGHALARTGDAAAARSRLRELEERARTRFVPAEYFAIVHVGLGEYDEAVKWLEKSAAEGSGAVLYLNVEPLLDPLRRLPRFQRLVGAVGLPQQVARD
jgi:DNA-binding SARP family transcriptional activator/TolB-like protein